MDHKDETVIHIDKKEFKVQNPTTGRTLYDLGRIDQNQYDVYREVHGKGDDEYIPYDAPSVELKNGDHFFSVQKKLNPGR